MDLRLKGRMLAGFLLFLFLSTNSSYGAGLSDGVSAFENGDYALAYDIFRSLSEDGDDKAQQYLGRMYRFGQGVENNNNEAARWYRKSAEQGNVISIMNLDIMYSQGIGATSEEIFEWYLKLAEQGVRSGNQPPGLLFVAAQHNVGIMYLRGRGVDKNNHEGIKWLKEAAENGYDESIHSLALEKVKGEATQKNVREAVDLFEKVASKGDPRSQFLLGLIYREGDGVPQNHAKAFEWLSKAAQQGVEQAQPGLFTGPT